MEPPRPAPADSFGCAAAQTTEAAQRTRAKWHGQSQAARDSLG